jgi:broad specificity phosphatase PhoE
MIKKLYLVRHGQSHGNATGDYSTSAHDNLTPCGKDQANRLAQGLMNLDLQRVFCSPLGRARQTLFPFLELAGRSAGILPSVAESCWQDEKDMTLTPEIPKPIMKLEPLEEPFFKWVDPHAPHFWEWETWGDGFRRVEYTKAWIDQQNLDSALIVSHGYFISLLECLLLNRKAELRHDIPNTGVNLYVYDQNQYIHEIRDNLSHLKESE